jgi:hypothetical protein
MNFKPVGWTQIVGGQVRGQELANEVNAIVGERLDRGQELVTMLRDSHGGGGDWLLVFRPRHFPGPSTATLVDRNGYPR